MPKKKQVFRRIFRLIGLLLGVKLCILQWLYCKMKGSKYEG